MMPEISASVPDGVGAANVAAKVSISSGGNQPKPIPAPTTAPVTARNATHHQP